MFICDSAVRIRDYVLLDNGKIYKRKLGVINRKDESVFFTINNETHRIISTSTTINALDKRKNDFIRVGVIKNE